MKPKNSALTVLWTAFATLLRRFLQTFAARVQEDDFDHLTINISTR